MSAAGLLVSAAVSLSLPQLPDAECIEASFVQTRQLPALDAPLELEGRVRVEREQDFAWQVTRPYAYRYEVRDNRVTEVLPDGARRQTPLARVPGIAVTSELFGALVRGRIEPLQAYFSIAGPTDTDAGLRLELTPEAPPMNAILERVRVEYGEWVRLLVIDGTDGSRSRIEFGPPAACGDDETA